jgi:hypothetical protein
MSAMGYSGSDIVFSYLPQTFAFIIGGYTCRNLLSSCSSDQILPWLLKLFILSVTSISVIALTVNQNSIISLLIPMCFMAAANGQIYPRANNALVTFKENSASASGLMNFMQIVLCMLASAVVSLLSGYGVIAMTAVMMFQVTLLIVGYGLIRK